MHLKMLERVIWRIYNKIITMGKLDEMLITRAISQR